MRDRPLTNLCIAIALFVVVSLVGAHFRHGFNSVDLLGVFIGTLGSYVCFGNFIWPDRAIGPASGRIGSLLSFGAVGMLTALFLLDTYNITNPSWMEFAFYFLCGCYALYAWIQRRKNARRNDMTNSLQMRLIAKNRDHGD